MAVFDKREVKFLIKVLILIQAIQISYQSVCNTGQYADHQGQCQMCDPSCKECETEANNCTECVEEFTVKNGNRCNCIAGYQRNEEHKCVKCEACVAGFYSPYNNLCPNVQTDCTQKCKAKCETCQFQDDQCTTCKAGKNRINIPPKCECAAGYYDSDGASADCLPCQENCQSCSNSDHCDECQNGYFLKDNKCTQCYYYNSNICLQKCPENTQPEEYSGRCEDIQQVTMDEGYLIAICVSVGIVFIALCILAYNKLKNRMHPTQQHQYSKKNSQDRDTQSNSMDGMPSHSSITMKSKSDTGVFNSQIMKSQNEKQQSHEELQQNKSITDSDSTNNSSPMKKRKSGRQFSRKFTMDKPNLAVIDEEKEMAESHVNKNNDNVDTNINNININNNNEDDVQVLTFQTEHNEQEQQNQQIMQKQQTVDLQSSDNLIKVSSQRSTEQDQQALAVQDI